MGGDLTIAFRFPRREWPGRWPAIPVAFGRCNPIDMDGLTVPVIGRAHLLANKRASGRPKDLLNAETLSQHDP